MKFIKTQINALKTKSNALKPYKIHSTTNTIHEKRNKIHFFNKKDLCVRYKVDHYFHQWHPESFEFKNEDNRG